MRIVLFDWTSGGHHALYLRRFAEVLAPHAEVVLAVADELAGQLVGAPGELRPLGSTRPLPDPSRPAGEVNRELADAELDLMYAVAAETGATDVVHLNADPVIRRLVRRPPLDAHVTLVVFRPRAHFRRAYGARLGAADRVRASFLEALIARWRRQPDAHALLTLDEEAARRWTRRGGAPAYWFPEPPVAGAPEGSATRDALEREGCVLYGALAPRKGVDRLARAVATQPAVSVTLAGAVEAGYEDELERHLATMRDAGARVDAHPHHHTEAEGLERLRRAKCAVLPYPRHNGMSRVLVEAAAVGTPVVVHDYGMLGHLVRRHGLGVAVDCADEQALGGVLADMTANAHQERYREALARFAARYALDAFERSVLAAFSLPARRPGSR